MIFAAAVVTGLALGALMPAAEAGSPRGMPIAALLVPILSAVAARPILAPHNSWPGLASGLAAVAGARVMSRVERRLGGAAADRAVAVNGARLTSP